MPEPTPTPASAKSARLPLRRAARLRLDRVVRAPFGDVPGPLPPGRRADTGLDEQPSSAQERGMRAFWWDGFWASSSETIILNYLGLYLLAFGASNSQVGLLSSLSSLCAAVAFFPGARLVETVGHRKPIVLLTGGGIARISLLGLAAVPLFVDGGSAIWIVMALASFRGFWGYFAVPAWTSLTADIVPLGIRGRFLASRNFGMGLATLATAPLAGYLIDRFTGLHGWQLVWLIAFATGAISTWCYARIPEPEEHTQIAPAARAGGQPNIVRDIASDRNFMLYLMSIAIWNVALTAAGPFFNVYLVKNLHASTAMVGFLSALPALTGLAGVVYFGRMMDQRGTKWVMAVNAVLIPLLPTAWMIITAAWQVIFINSFGGLIWAGYNLALLNMVMVMAPPEKRARYSAAFQTVTFASSFAGPMLGGFVIDAMGFKAVFLLSAIGRLASSAILLRFVEYAHDEQAGR